MVVTLKTNFVLVDYENVQPTDLALLCDGPFKVRVFLGPNQAKIPVSLAKALQALGRDAEYVVLETAGRNALDFHIAYYLGTLSTHEPSAFFHIISKDSGFDPLINHLKSRGVLAHRSVTVAEIPFFKSDAPATEDAQVNIAVAHLVRLKAAKPRAQKTLRSTMHALFKKALTEEQMAGLFASLCKRGVVKIEGNKVSYDLPPVP
jgi:hypothetical protein